MMSLTSNDLKTWQVNYTATYWVRATSEDEAIDLAMEQHADLPDGSWEGFIDNYDSENYNDLGEK
jgi:spore germination protein YaaH